MISKSSFDADEIFFEDNSHLVETNSETAFFGVNFGSINLESKILEKALTEERFFSLKALNHW